MILVIIFIIGADICWHIWEYEERKRLNNCWDDVFNAKIESEERWGNLCRHYLDKITELTEKQKDNK